MGMAQMAFGKFQLQFHFGTEIVAFDVDTGVDMVLDVMDKEDHVKQQRRIVTWDVKAHILCSCDS